MLFSWQAPESLRKVFAASCIKLGEEVSRVLRGVAQDLKAKQKTKPKEILLYKVRLTIEDLNYAVRTYPQFIYVSRLQNPNANYNNSIPTPNPNYTTQSTFICHDLKPPPCSSHNPKMNEPHDSNPSLNQMCNSNNNPHPISHVFSIPNSSSHVNVGAYSLPPNSNPNPNPISNSSPCIGIEVPNSDHISMPDHLSTFHSNSILNSHPNSNFLGEKESTLSINLQKSKGNEKVCPMLHESMEFAESLSLASLITLLIEFVARVEHLLDALGDFQDQAGFRNVEHDEENPCIDTKLEVNHTHNHTLNHPPSTLHVE